MFLRLFLSRFFLAADLPLPGREGKPPPRPGNACSHARKPSRNAHAGQAPAHSPEAAHAAGKLRHASAGPHDALHHPAHLVKLLEQLIDLLHGCAGPSGDAGAPAAR